MFDVYFNAFDDLDNELETLLLNEHARSYGWSSYAEMVAAENAHYDNFIPAVPTDPAALRDYFDIPF